MSVIAKNIKKKFGSFCALNNINLEIQSGELIALLGPSGSGKTTLLRIIAGLESPDSGEILLEGKDIANKDMRDRQVGFVFQHYALFRHMTVFQNIAFGLTVAKGPHKLDPDALREKVFSLASLVHIESLLDRYPSQLSGGQRQRVALARTLAVEPRVLLLDEPFGALDAKVRKELRRWIRNLHDEIHLTSLFVTHDQEEAMEVADRIIVMNQGKIEQIGTPEEIYHHPVNSFIYDFIGNYNEFAGWKDEQGRLHLLDYDVGSNERPRPPRTFTPLQVFSRPHDLLLSLSIDHPASITARVVHINPAGPLVRVELEQWNHKVLQAEISAETYQKLRLQRGDTVFATPQNTRVF